MSDSDLVYTTRLRSKGVEFALFGLAKKKKGLENRHLRCRSSRHNTTVHTEHTNRIWYLIYGAVTVRNRAKRLVRFSGM